MENIYRTLSKAGLLLAIVLFWPLPMLGQHGISAHLTMPANPSPYFSDWLDGSQDMQLLVSNNSDQTWFVQFSFTLTLDGQQVVANDVNLMEPEIIDPGTHIFALADIFPAMDVWQITGQVEQSLYQTGKLPAGFYMFCVQLFEMESQQWITEPSCQMITITDYQPPVLVSPFDGQEFLHHQPLQFQFSPVSPSVPPSSSLYPITYHLMVMEVMEGQSHMDAFLSNIPVFEQFTDGQTHVFWSPDFDPPSPGKDYVWSVRALDAMENPFGLGEGWADPQVFSTFPDDEEPDMGFALQFILISPDGSFVQDAVISMDGVFYPPGQYIFEPLLEGNYVYEIFTEMYQPVTGSINIVNEDVLLEYVLQPVADDEDPPVEDDYYTLVFQLITSDGTVPEGFVITLAGETYPTGVNVFDSLLPGAYPYQVYASGFQLFEGSVEILDQDVEISVILIPEEEVPDDPPTEEYYSLFIDVSDQDGTVVSVFVITLAGETYPTGVNVFDSLLPGAYPYQVYASGFQLFEGSVEISDQDVEISVILIPEEDVPDDPPSEEYYSLFIDVSDQDGTVVSDFVINFDDVLYPSGQQVIEKVLPGIYTLEVSAGGYLPVKKEVEIVDSPVYVQITLTSESIPPDAEPEIDLPPVSLDPQDDCSCTQCFVFSISVMHNNQVLTLHREAPLAIGNTYVFSPFVVSDCPDDCPKSYSVQMTFETRDQNDRIVHTVTIQGNDKITFRPRRSGQLHVTASAAVTCQDVQCKCNPLVATFPVRGMTIAGDFDDPGIDLPADDPDGWDEKPEYEEPESPDTPDVFPPTEELDPPFPPYIPPYFPPADPVTDICNPSVRKEAGPPIVLNVDLENPGTFPYPRAVALHAHAIDWDLVFFECIDCDGLRRELMLPVMDRVSNFHWELLGKGSLNDPFRADEVMDMENQAQELADSNQELKDIIDQLEKEIQMLPQDLEERQRKAREKIG